MNVTVENLAPCKKLVRVEVAPEQVEAAFVEVTRDYQKHAELPGFRPGKAPKEMVAKRYETEIQNEAKRKLIGDSYKQAVTEQKLKAVVQPDIEEVQFGRSQPMIFTATIETAPEFTLPEYKGLPARREIGGATPEDVEKAINLLRDRAAKFETVAREVKEEDFVVVNYTGTCEGKPITDLAPAARGLTEQKAFWVRVEKDSFIPGFAIQLIGAKAGDKKTVTVQFPADFVTPQLAGQKGVYEVEVVEVKEKVLPELNDDYAKTLDAPSLEALRKGVHSDLQNEWNQKQSRNIRNQVVQALANQVKCDLPESLIHSETRSIVYDLVSQNQQRGVPKEVLDAQKEQIYASANNLAKERVKIDFIFDQIAEKEGVRVEQLEIVQRLQLIATQAKMPFQKLLKDFQESGRIESLYVQMRNDKVVDLLVQFAKIEDVPAQPAA